MYNRCFCGLRLMEVNARPLVRGLPYCSDVCKERLLQAPDSAILLARQREALEGAVRVLHSLGHEIPATTDGALARIADSCRRCRESRPCHGCMWGSWVREHTCAECGQIRNHLPNVVPIRGGVLRFCNDGEQFAFFRPPGKWAALTGLPEKAVF